MARAGASRVLILRWTRPETSLIMQLAGCSIVALPLEQDCGAVAGWQRRAGAQPERAR